MSEIDRTHVKGRGAQIKPPNRFDRIHYEDDLEQVELDDDFMQSRRSVKTEYLPDDSQSVITENDSPDDGETLDADLEEDRVG